MFNSIAKRQLERQVQQLVQNKGAAWCLQSQMVQGELQRSHPTQLVSVEALCNVVVSGGLTYLLSLTDPTSDEAAKIRVIQRVQTYGVAEKEAQWAVQCWVAAVAVLPHQQRIEILNQLKAQIEAQKQAKIAEEKRQQVEAERAIHEQRRLMEEARVRAEAGRRAEAAAREAEAAALKNARIESEARFKAELDEAKRRDYLIECWQFAFPTEAKAIQEAARRPARSLMEAENGGFRLFNSGSQAERDYYAEIEQRAVALAVDEIWRRISTATDQEALRRKLEAARQAELQRRSAEAEHNRQIAEETQRRQQAQAEMERKQTRIDNWRRRFPLQCAGVDDEEVWKQILASPHLEADYMNTPIQSRGMLDRFLP